VKLQDRTVAGTFEPAQHHEPGYKYHDSKTLGWNPGVHRCARKAVRKVTDRALRLNKQGADDKLYQGLYAAASNGSHCGSVHRWCHLVITDSDHSVPQPGATIRVIRASRQWPPAVASVRVFGRDQAPDRPCRPGSARDQALALQSQNHLMHQWRCDLEVTVRLRGRPSVEFGVIEDEREVLALLCPMTIVHLNLITFVAPISCCIHPDSHGAD
jgi:hypothetical protein